MDAANLVLNLICVNVQYRQVWKANTKFYLLKVSSSFINEKIVFFLNKKYEYYVLWCSESDLVLVLSSSENSWVL